MSQHPTSITDIRLPNWSAPWPDKTMPNAGLPLLPSTSHHLVYLARQEMGMYNHCPILMKETDYFVAAWCSHADDEMAPGQRVLMSSSPDGCHWAIPTPLLDSLSPMKQLADGEGIFMNCRQFVRIENRYYGFGEAYQITAWTDGNEIVTSGDRQKHTGCVHHRIGTWMRQIQHGMPCGDPFWIHSLPQNDHAIVSPILASWQDMDETVRHDCQQIIDRNLFGTQDPEIAMRDYMNNLIARKDPDLAARVRLCEPQRYTLKDGTSICLFRDDKYSLRLFAAYRDSSMDDWSIARQTNIPDSAALFNIGMLPKGQWYLIGNNIPIKWCRDPLTIACSYDGITFDRAWALRANAPQQRHYGMYKGPGFQYPFVLMHEGDLWVIYSVNKEDIEITQIPIDDNFA